MTEFLEMIMLICFGVSWPFSVVRNIKAKTAKGMSIEFTLLIIVGYIAGIGAKIYSGNVGFVLFVYLLNLVMVSANLVVFFINRHLDKKKELAELNAGTGKKLVNIHQ